MIFFPAPGEPGRRQAEVSDSSVRREQQNNGHQYLRPGDHLGRDDDYVLQQCMASSHVNHNHHQMPDINLVENHDYDLGHLGQGHQARWRTASSSLLEMVKEVAKLFSDLNM